MPPNDQQQPSQQDYNFILNSQQQKSGSSFGAGMSTGKKIILGVALFIVLGIAATVVSQIATSGQRALNANLKAIVARQQEILRVSGMGVNDADAMNQDTLGYVYTVKLATHSEQTEFIAMLKESGIKIGEADLGVSKNPQADEALKLAKANNRYDEEMRDRLQANLEDYQRLILAVYDQVGPGMQALFDRALESSDALLPLEEAAN